MKIEKLFLAALLTLAVSAASAQTKKVSVLGDSYSTFKGCNPEGYAPFYPDANNDVKEVSQTWWDLYIKAMGYELEQNNSWGGTTICNTGYFGRDVSSSSFYSRLGMLGDPDIIFLFGGTNDAWSNAPIGEYKYSGWTDEDCKAYRPALARLLVGLKEKYPDAVVYAILNSELKEEINESTREICSHYGVQLIELYDIEKQNGHPSIKGMQSISDQLQAAIKAEIYPEVRKAPKKDITIIFENDAHSTLSGYPKMATAKAQALAETRNVLTCSCGDFSTDFMPGPGLGRNTQGAGIIKVMNVVGYDYVVPGNHDFDFSIPVLQENMKKLKAGAVCSNAVNTKTGEPLFPGYMIRRIGGVKIAFVGVITPTTMSKRNQKMFSDEAGNIVYSFMNGSVIGTVQANVDKARAEGADYVIVLSHLGDKANGTTTSIDLIKGTNGIDIVLDGHAHTVIAGDKYANKDGKSVLLTSTGLKFANIGKVAISKDGTISSILLPTDNIEPDAKAQAAIEKITAISLPE